MLGQDVQCPEVFNETVGQSTVELQPVAVRTHAAVTQQIAGVLVREEVFSRRHRTGIEVRDGGLEGIVERIADLLIPEQRVLAQHLGIGDAGLEIEATVGIDGELGIGPDLLEHGLDAAAVLANRRAADLHLHDVVAAVQVAAHFRLQRGVVLAGIVVAAGSVDEDPRVGLLALHFGQQAEQRLPGDLGGRIPDRHIERSDGDGTLAVTAGLLVRHHLRPDAMRI